jgi:methyl-accepting chemotaxis protein
MSIRVRFIVIIGILSLVASVVLAYASYQFSLKNAMADAKKQGAIVFNMIHSSRMYFKKSQRPLVTELVEEDRFFPEIMSGFVMTRGVWEIFEKRFPGYKFKQATLDPLYPPNKADVDETKLIAQFDADKKVKNREGTISKNGKQFYYFAKPILVGDKCLRCHGNPEDAPKDQVEIYGTESGYDWHKGQVVSTAIVYVPLDTAIVAARKAATNLFAMGTAGIVLLMAVIWFFLSNGIVTPLARLEQKTRQISLGKELDEDIGVNSKDEIGDLAKAIDRLRISTAKLLKRCASK